MSIKFGFTGEPTDTNDLVYLRNRYYNPHLGTFLSMDPHEGDFNDPMSLNRYAYARGNPVNLTDPSGLCAESDPNLTQCHQDANYLTIFGFYPLWDENPLERIPEELCLQAEVALAIQSNQKLKWTADEMRSLRNAVNVLYRANQNIDGFKEKYRFPVTPISIVKRDTLTPVPSPTPTPPPNATPVPIAPPIPIAGTAYSQDRIIALTQDVWSGLDQQEQSWLMIHEFGHILVRDLGKDANTLYNDRLPARFKTSGHFPTRYANSGGPNEFIIEALTGTLWNRGYTTVPGYESNAGGRTGWLDLETHQNDVQVFTVTRPDRTTYQAAVVNVDLNLLGGQTLGEWIIQELFGEA